MASTSCEDAPEPLQLNWLNNTISNDGQATNRGIIALVGTPGQKVSLTPTLSLNNSFVNNIGMCNGSTTNDTCLSLTGGVYDSSGSSTYSPSALGSWNGSAEIQSSLLFNQPFLYMNDKFQIAGQEIDGFPLAIESSSIGYGGIGLGTNSTLMFTLRQQNAIPSNSFSLYTGQYSYLQAGALVLGGYSDAFYEGELFNVTDYTSFGCAACLNITSIRWRSSQGETDLFGNRTASDRWMVGVVDPYQPVVALPQDIFDLIASITGGQLSNDTFPIMSYPGSASLEGEMIITIAEGLETTIPSEALFTPTAYTNGIVEAYYNNSNQYAALTNLQALTNVDTADYEYSNQALLGLPYTAFIYLIKDYERGNVSVAKAANITDATYPSTFTRICSLENTSEKSSSGSNAGAIAGGVVGGVLGVALIILGIWWFMRRKKKKQKQSQKSSKVEAVEAPLQAEHTTPLENKGISEGEGTVSSKSELPPYEKPVAELNSSNQVREMEDTGVLQLEGSNTVTRSELPG